MRQESFRKRKAKSCQKIKICRALWSPAYQSRIQFGQNRYFVLISSGCPGRSVLLVALAAVNRPGSIRLEGDLGLLAAFGAGYICHFSGAAVVAISEATAVVVLSLKHLIHLPCYRFKEPIMLQKTSQQISLNRRKM